MKFHLPTINQFATLLFLNITNAVFQLLVIPILIHNTAADQLGTYFIALSFSVLASIFVNFGTSQTAVVEIRKTNSPEAQKVILNETLALRLLPMLVSVIISCLLPIILTNGIYFLLVLPMILAEFINPQFYLIATYKIKNYTLYNLLIRIIVIAAIFYYKANPSIIAFTLLATGLAMLFLNIIFLRKTFFIKGTVFNFPSSSRWTQLIRTNILVVGNGLTVHLQQSMFLFALPSMVTPLYLSAYGFIDKLISSFRMLLNAYSTAVMPHAAGAHHESFANWKKLKQQQNKLLTIICIGVGIIMYLFHDQILSILLFGKNKNQVFFNQTSELIKLISFVPLLISLNVLNVAELILEKKFIAYFSAGIAILFISLFCVDALKLGIPNQYAGYYPLLIEASCLIIYYLIVQKLRSEKR